jgi:hypothetical protein
MSVKVRPFRRTTEASFPENESLPNKNLDSEQFDKKFKEWWDDVKLNLSRLDDQISKFVKLELSDNITKVKSENEINITKVDESAKTSITALQNEIASLRANLYSE